MVYSFGLAGHHVDAVVFHQLVELGGSFVQVFGDLGNVFRMTVSTWSISSCSPMMRRITSMENRELETRSKLRSMTR